MQTKSFLKIWLLRVNFENFTFINQKSDQSQSGVWRAVIGRSFGLWREFLKLTNSN